MFYPFAYTILYGATDLNLTWDRTGRHYLVNLRMHGRFADSGIDFGINLLERASLVSPPDLRKPLV